ncbi:FkbM family methyltransferase [uncultured Thiodictyon sp.]|uniref:FkbM family methyltransferase n=1 Tax=uncultured Thiodictyon sp. TaxID=1846217 RepID=UPI0025CDFAD0|nr:FkbM family methyltransferase [uncultured Thiodictyon sp.]
MTERSYILPRALPAPPDIGTALALLRQVAAEKTTLAPRLVDRPLALYGAGDLGRLARDYFTRVGISIDFVVDRDAERLANSAAWEGVHLLTPDAVPAQARKSMLLAVCVATIPYTTLDEDLRQCGWVDVAPFYDIAEAYRDRHPLSNGWFAPPLVERDLVGIASVLAGWGDNLSRAHHLQFLAWRRLREEWNFIGAPVTTDDRYFIADLRALLTNHEAFADIGAHQGRVIRRFLEAVKGRCAQIWAVEPDPDSLVQLHQLAGGLGLPDGAALHIIPRAVAEAQREARFAAGLDYASQLSELGEVPVPVTTIDQLGLAPSFLKLHLEGGELAALRGARQTLARCRPLLAVTSYHNSQGLWELPLWLMQTLPDYRFLMRLHSWVGTGAVIYGLPSNPGGNAREAFC